MCPLCLEKRKSSCVECRFKQYLADMQDHSETEKKIVEEYRTGPIKEAVDLATQFDYNLYQLEAYENIKEAYGFEVACKKKSEILTEHPCHEKIKRIVQEWASIRKNTWYRLFYKQTENIQKMPRNYLHQYDSEKNLVGPVNIGIESAAFLYPVNLCNTDPEQAFIICETHQKIDKLPSEIGSMPLKRAATFQRILEKWLGGYDVSPKNGGLQGIPDEKLTGYKHQAKNKAKNFWEGSI